MKINNLENQEEILNQENNDININQENDDLNNNNEIEEILNQSNDYIPAKLDEYIKVFCRFRPASESELSYSTNNSVIILSPTQLIITQDKKLELKKDYTFDGLFEYNTLKEKFYLKTSYNIVNSVLQGFNGGIICYGETGTGKSYTLKEIIPQVEKQIFEYINESDNSNELFKIDVSMIEIYKEQVNDLIDLKNTNLNLIEKKNKKLIIDNLTHVGVSTQEQLEQIINKGMLNRNNKESNYKSKSHFIIMITIYHYFKNENYIKTGKLYLVDLEGSDKITKLYLENDNNLEEQKLINKSLIALSIIVQNLSNENDNITYAPYRDSKLTRIISDCFGGNAYTSLILNCSKHECSTVQTRNTFMFGEKAKKIKNKPVINIETVGDKGIILGDIFEANEENINLENKDIYLDDKKYLKLKLQIKTMKEKIDLLSMQNAQLKERNALLENEKKNFYGNNSDKNNDILNKIYIKNNINDLHELLNEKEAKESELINELNNIKIILEQKLKENEELKSNQEENIKTCQELTECLNEAGNQIKKKDDIINELNNKIKEDDKNNNELKIEINNLKEEINKNKNESNNEINKARNDLKEMNDKIKEVNTELNNELNNKKNILDELNKEKNEKTKYKEYTEKKIIRLEEQIKQLKENNNVDIIRNQKIELDNLNKRYEDSNKKINRLEEENNRLKNKYDSIEKEKKIQPKNLDLINENNTLKNQIKLLEKNYNSISLKNKELLTQINQKNTKNYVDTKETKEAKEINNLKMENKKLNEKIIILEKQKKESEKIKYEIKTKDKNYEDNDDKIKEINKLKKDIDNITRENNRNKNTIETLRKEISEKNRKSKDKNYENNDDKINDINKLKKDIDNITRENNRNKYTIETLRKEISEKKRIIEEIQKNNQNTQTINIRTNSVSGHKYNNNDNKYISDIRQRNELITKENNENKIVIEKLRKEIISKTKIIEENNKYKQCTCDKNMIEKLKKEICSKNYTIMDYKTKLDNLIKEEINYKNTINRLRTELSSKEKMTFDNKKNNNKNYDYVTNNNIIVIDRQIRNNSQDNNKYGYNRRNQSSNKKNNDIESYENKEYNNKYNYEINKDNKKITELERIINELKIENSQLKEKVIDYENLKAEIEFIYKRGGNYCFKETNKTSLKLAYDTLIEENKTLKQRIYKLEKKF